MINFHFWQYHIKYEHEKEIDFGKSIDNLWSDLGDIVITADHPFKCNHTLKCKYVAKTAGHLNSHMKLTHQIQEILAVEKPRATFCDFCEKYFETFLKLEQHIDKVHVGGRGNRIG